MYEVSKNVYRVRTIIPDKVCDLIEAEQKVSRPKFKSDIQMGPLSNTVSNFHMPSFIIVEMTDHEKISELFSATFVRKSPFLTLQKPIL